MEGALGLTSNQKISPVLVLPQGSEHSSNLHPAKISQLNVMSTIWGYNREILNV